MLGQVATAPRSVSLMRSARLLPRLCGLVLVAAASSVAAGCSNLGGSPSAAPAASAAPGGPSGAATATGQHAVPAVILGDSLSVQATPQYQAKIPQVVVDAVIGRTIVKPNLTDEGLSRVPELKTVDAAWFVVELGTNDSTFAGYPADQMTADVGALLDAIGRDRCIAWVLPYAKDPRTAIQIADTETFRQIATTAVQSLTCGRVLDWGDMVKADPHLIGSDGVHLTDLGMQRLAELVAFGIG